MRHNKGIWSAEARNSAEVKRTDRRKRKRFEENPLEVAFEEGWRAALGLHIDDNGVTMTEAWDRFLSWTEGPLTIREFPAGEEGR